MDFERYEKHRCRNCQSYDHCLNMCIETGEYCDRDDGYSCELFEEKRDEGEE